MRVGAPVAERPSLSPACGILYAEDFDDEPPAVLPLEADPAPEPVFTLAELDDARRLAAERARQAAVEEAEVSALQQRGAVLAVIAGELGRMQECVAEEVARATEELAHAVLSLLCAGLPSLMEGTARREINGLLARLLPGLRTEKRVTVRVHPDLATAVRDDLLALDEEQRACLEVVGAEALAPGDLRVSWHEGRLVRDTAAIHRVVQHALAAAGCGGVDHV